jgi:hypothetical protein
MSELRLGSALVYKATFLLLGGTLLGCIKKMLFSYF